eukprot:Gb_41592 [translate_table: standard]
MPLKGPMDSKPIIIKETRMVRHVHWMKELELTGRRQPRNTVTKHRQLPGHTYKLHCFKMPKGCPEGEAFALPATYNRACEDGSNEIRAMYLAQSLIKCSSESGKEGGELMITFFCQSSGTQSLLVLKPSKPVEWRVVRRHRQSVTTIALTEDDSRGFSASKDGTIIHWDVETGACEKYEWPRQEASTSSSNAGSKNLKNKGFKKQGSKHVLALAVSSDGRYLATGGLDRYIHLWDTRTREHIQAFPGHRGAVSCLAFRQGTQQLISGSFDRTIKLWSVEDRSYIDTLYGHQSEILMVDCLRKERVLSAGRDHTLRLWKVLEVHIKPKCYLFPTFAHCRLLLVLSEHYLGAFFRGLQNLMFFLLAWAFGKVSNLPHRPLIQGPSAPGLDSYALCSFQRLILILILRLLFKLSEPWCPLLEEKALLSGVWTTQNSVLPVHGCHLLSVHYCLLPMTVSFSIIAAEFGVPPFIVSTLFDIVTLLHRIRCIADTASGEVTTLLAGFGIHIEHLPSSQFSIDAPHMMLEDINQGIRELSSRLYIQMEILLHFLRLPRVPLSVLQMPGPEIDHQFFLVTTAPLALDARTDGIGSSSTPGCDYWSSLRGELRKECEDFLDVTARRKRGLLECMRDCLVESENPAIVVYTLHGITVVALPWVTGLLHKLQGIVMAMKSMKDGILRHHGCLPMKMLRGYYELPGGIKQINAAGMGQHSTENIQFGMFESDDADTCFQLWVPVPEETQLVFRGHAASLECCCFVNNEEFISGSDDGSIELWTLLRKKPVFIAKNAHGPSVLQNVSVDLSTRECPDEELTTRQLSNGIDTGKLFTIYKYETEFTCSAVSCFFAALSFWIIPCYLILKWNGHVAPQMRVSSAVESWVGAVAVCRGSDLVASGAGDGMVRLWAIESGNKSLQTVHDIPLFNIGWVPTSPYIHWGFVMMLFKMLLSFSWWCSIFVAMVGVETSRDPIMKAPGSGGVRLDVW